MVDVNVRSHNRIPRPFSFKPLVLNNAPSTNMTSFILLNKTCKVLFLKSFFLQSAVNGIFSIPLSPTAKGDSLYRSFEERKVYQYRAVTNWLCP